MSHALFGHRNVRGKYFMVPNDIFLLDLTAGEIAVYCYLLRCENRNTYQCWPSYATIGENVGLSVNTVRKHVKSLEEKCLIYTEPTTVTLKDGTVRNGSLLYTIRPIEDAWAYYIAKQQEKNDQMAFDLGAAEGNSAVAPV